MDLVRVRAKSDGLGLGNMFGPFKQRKHPGSWIN